MSKSDPNGEVTIIITRTKGPTLCTEEYNLGLSKGDRIGEVTLLVR